MTLRELHKAAIRNVPANHPKEAAWFMWWLLRGGLDYRAGVSMKKE